MKKNGKLLAALFLFSSVLVSPITTIANAEEITKTETAQTTADSTTTDPGATEASTTESSVAESSTTESSTTESSTAESSTTESSTTESSTTESSTTESSTTESSTTDPDAALTAARATLQTKVNDAKGYLDYDKYTTESLFYLENFILYAEGILANPDATLDEVNNAIDMIDAAVTAVKSLPRDPKDKIVINATNQTMYVGDVLTPEMVLEWANIANGDGLYLQFEIIGTPITVNKVTNQLVQAGTYTIRYTIKSADFDGNPLSTKANQANPQMTVMSKDITLTVLNKETPTDPVDPTDPVKPMEPVTPATPVTDPVAKPVASPVAKKEKDKDKKNLPETGTKESSMMLSSIGLTLIAGVYFTKKRKENEFDLY